MWRALLEGDSKTELDHAWRKGQVDILGGVAIIRVGLVEHVRAKVFVIEGVKHLDNAIDGRLSTHRKTPLDAHVDSVQWKADETIARDNRAVGPQATGRFVPSVAQVAPVVIVKGHA